MSTHMTDPPEAGRVVRHGDTRYDTLRAGFNLAVEHRPDLIVDATGRADVVAAVQLAGDANRAVAVMNTGHSASVSADGAVLIRTGRMQRVDVDPVRRTARIEAGAAWQSVLDAATPYGLAPLNGTSPHVGAVGYTLGGGVGLLARRFGFAADHVRWFDLVTADGSQRRVTADEHPDLFWALRGAGPNFGVVTAMEIDLFDVPSILGGELCFPAEASADVLHAYADWAAEVPETMASSVLLLAYPDDPAVPPALRGRYITHLRLAYSGDDQAEGRQWVQQLRKTAAPVVDTVRELPYAEVGTIHHEPVDMPVPAFDRNLLLRAFDHDAVSTLAHRAGPDAPFLTELRAWGGALSRPPAVPNPVGGRDAAFSLLAISDPELENRRRRDALLAAMQPYATGSTYPNFSGVEDSSPDAVRRGFSDHDFARLQELKAGYDPHNMFRINFNIPPRD